MLAQNSISAYIYINTHLGGGKCTYLHNLSNVIRSFIEVLEISIITPDNLILRPRFIE